MRNYPANIGDARRNDRSASARATGPERDAQAVAIVSYDGVAAFELGVACDVFGGGAERAAAFGVPWYRSFVCGIAPGPVTTDSGFQILPAARAQRESASASTVIVLPTVSFKQVPAEVLEVLRQAHARGSRIVSLCTGAFALAGAGLLDGRRATTHWTECDELARRHPKVSVDPGVLFVDEGDILTSAGSAASIDLCLHVVRQDYGTEIATQLARQLVVPPQRDGGQAQYIDAPMPALDSSSLFADTVLAPGASGRTDNSRRTGGTFGHEPPDVRPPVPGQHRHDPVPVAGAPARPARPATPRDKRPADRFSRGEKRLLYGSQPAQALQPNGAHQPPGLSAHLRRPRTKLTGRA